MTRWKERRPEKKGQPAAGPREIMGTCLLEGQFLRELRGPSLTQASWERETHEGTKIWIDGARTRRPCPQTEGKSKEKKEKGSP